MAQIEGIDGTKYEVPDDVLARYRIGEETVGKMVQHDDVPLPVAPPPQAGWDHYNDPTPPQPPTGLESNPFVRTQRGPNNELIINIVMPGAQ